MRMPVLYQGLDRFECREKIVEDLERDGMSAKNEDYRHMVGHCYRCKTIVEPNLSLQWFVKTKTLGQDCHGSSPGRPDPNHS